MGRIYWIEEDERTVLLTYLTGMVDTIRGHLDVYNDKSLLNMTTEVTKIICNMKSDADNKKTFVSQSEYKNIVETRKKDWELRGRELKKYMDNNNVSVAELAKQSGKTKASINAFCGNCTVESYNTLTGFVDLIVESRDSDVIRSEDNNSVTWNWDKVKEKWNKISPHNIRNMTVRRKRAFKARVKEYGTRSFNEVLYKISKSDFLLGKSGRCGEHQNFKADFDWVMTENNYAKILEGKYDN